ncbi:MAG: two-component sensor histidine kinase [Gammaproteobacteria bacterium]|nr:two-component sensor histidine kinase [Gammaproteobacteria bacterium]MBU1441770.1 two-component sensor histidine kinase [Gammaproteobacteria bacterium]
MVPLVGLTLLILLGGIAIVRWDIATRREAFSVDARISHRLLSQQAAQLDAVLAMLVLLAPAADTEEPALRVPALWPAVLSVQRSDAQHPWADAALAAAEAQSRALAAGQRHAVLAAVDPARAQYTLVLAGNPVSWALRVDARRLVPTDGWPLSDVGPVRATLVAGSDALVLHAGAPQAGQPAGLTPGFTFAKVLATPSQPFELRLQRATGPAQWPWGWLLAWAAACTAATASLWALNNARNAQRRHAELMRMAQAARLNTLGELAAGMAHELNQPLAAVLASTQTAQRLLRHDEPSGRQAHDDEDPDLPAVRSALALAAAQARRASDVLMRLRRLVQDPTRGAVQQPVDLQALCAQMLRLLQPDLQRLGIAASLSGNVPDVWADPVMLEQIVHNLVTNAMQALEAAATPSPEISLVLQPAPRQAHAQLLVRDNGPGFAPEDLGRVFEPFFSTRAGGLGLGLPLCETLAHALGGTLQARNRVKESPGSAGAELALTLPLARTAPATGLTP